MASVDVSAQAEDSLSADMSEPPDDEALRMEEATLVAELFGEQSEDEDCQAIQLPPKKLLQTTLGQMFGVEIKTGDQKNPFERKNR